MLAKQKLLLAKEEATYGVDPTPTPAANAIDAKNIKVNYGGDVLERELERVTISPVAPKLGKRHIEISFTCELKGSGAAGTAPAIGDLLEACAFAETVNAGVDVTYKPASTGHKSVTLYVYELVDATNARLHKITGARGNPNPIFEAGQIARVEFSFQGLYTAPTDVAAPDAATYEATKPPIVESSQFTLNAVTSLILQSVNVDLANELNVNDDINSAGGVGRVDITGRKPNGSFNPEAVTKATYDWWADWIAATERALSLIVGSAAGNKITISCPKVTIDAISEGERNAIRTEEIPFRCAMDSGDDEIELKFE